MNWLGWMCAAFTIGMFAVLTWIAINSISYRNQLAKECEQHGGSLISTGNGDKCFKFERINLENERDR